MTSILLEKKVFLYEIHVIIKLVDVLKICLGIGRAFRRGRDKTRRGRRGGNENFGTGTTTKSP